MRTAVTGRPQRIVAAFSAICGLALLLVAAWPGVSQAAPAPITDYAGYPPALPASCTVDGPDVLQGVQFSAGGVTVTNLRDLNLTGGQTVTMTWTGFTPGCESLGIGLSFKIAKAPTFVISDNQYLQSFAYCGPDDTACAAPYSLTLTLPPAATVPCGQLDAHIGRPLAVVGPAGAYYNFNNPQNMLISAFNGGGGDCSVPPCATNPDVPAASMLCQAQPPTTTPPTTPPVCATNPALPANSPDCVPPTQTTSGQACATNPAVAADSPQCTPGTSVTSGQVCATNPAVMADSPECQPNATCPAGQQMDAATGSCVATSVLAARATIPFTGTNSARPQALLAGLLLLAGASLALLFRRRPGNHFAD